MKFNKKSISPVVATILLVIVSVVSVVSFMSWLSDFNSDLQSEGASKTDLVANPLIVQKVLRNGDVLVFNTGDSDVSITDIVVTNEEGEDCIYSSATTSIDISGSSVGTFDGLIDTTVDGCEADDIVDIILISSGGGAFPTSATVG